MATERPPTTEQERVLQHVTTGRNVVVHAPPGTGKTFCLLEATRRVLAASDAAQVFIGAYNTELAAEICQALEAEGGAFVSRVQCMTFHALCSRHIRLAADDAGLVEAVEFARVDPLNRVQKMRGVTHVFLDEVQDLTALHVAVLHLVLEVTPTTRHLLVGDAHQHLYDYGAHPSSLRYLAEPAQHFRSASPGDNAAWATEKLTLSMRVTAPMARVVDGLFGTGLRSGRVAAAGETPRRVRVHVAKKWDIGATILSVLGSRQRAALDRVAVLAATKASNAPLRAALNALSAAQIPLFVHGVDGASADVRRGKVRVSSFHAAKGTECDTAIVILPKSAKRNPLYVGLTRAREELHIVLVENEVDAVYGRALAHLVDEPGILAPATARTYELLAKLATLPPPPDATDVEATLARGASTEVEDAKPRVRALETCRDFDCLRYARISRRGPSPATPATPATPAPSEGEPSVDADGLAEAEDGGSSRGTTSVPGTVVATRVGKAHEDVMPIYRRAVLAKLEYLHTGRVRAVQDCIAPTRLDYEAQQRAIRAGHVGRLVSPFVTDASLLSSGLVAELLAAHGRGVEATAADWCTVAAGVTAWNGYHHTMRQALPTAAWVDDEVFDAAVERAGTALDALRCDPEDVIAFDCRLRRTLADDSVVHVRCDASSPRTGAWHFFWGGTPSTSDIREAALRASVHPRGVCYLVGLTDELSLTTVVADGAAAELALVDAIRR